VAAIARASEALMPDDERAELEARLTELRED
jgi:hypothetical protein